MLFEFGRRRAPALTLVAALAATPLCAQAQSSQPQSPQARDTPVVVELYTSQGCSSCPPADALLGELAERRDLITLSFHVDYWDYLGWRDPFGDPQNSQRQRAYAMALGSREIYTPQIVVQGAHGMVGSRAQVVKMAIMGHSEKPPEANVSLERAGGALTVRIAASKDASAGANSADVATSGELWLFGYDNVEQTEIRRGENSGKIIDYHHVVRETRNLGDWNGAALTSTVDVDPTRFGYAVLLQAPHLGPVLGAAKAELPSGS